MHQPPAPTVSERGDGGARVGGAPVIEESMKTLHHGFSMPEKIRNYAMMLA